MENGKTDKSKSVLKHLYEDLPSDKEPFDWTKYIWGGIILLIVVMLLFIWLSGQFKPRTSYVRAKHILIKFNPADPADRQRALKSITELREKILKGESFEKIAREYSNDSATARRGGDLGYYGRNSFDPAFEAYVWSAPIGQLSDVVETRYGFHLIIVVDRYLTEVDRYELELDEKARKSQSH
ncbi:MAG: peptidylprolyl isomerase [Candidatus Hydrogenedentes bacterium]|nr:peptidylprolyl isomerase [Candidatus Hydrogenedentota bacterium]